MTGPPDESSDAQSGCFALPGKVTDKPLEMANPEITSMSRSGNVRLKYQ